MPADKSSSLGQKVSDTMSQAASKASSTIAPSSRNTGPQPEDLPMDAAPGTDEEFGAHAATRDLQHKSSGQTGKGTGATDSVGDKVEGALLR